MSEQRVAKRKTHTKSRRGCLQCKQRHTKCNEARPKCANCIRLGISCTWPEITNGGSLSSRNTSPAALPSPLDDNPAVQSSANVFELSIPDMRLLHHWTIKGYIALHPELAKRSDIWQNAMLELAFEHTFLLHGILALSAVHKASFFLPADRQSLLLQADVHISQALDTMRKHLQTSNEVIAIPLFVLSTILLTYNFGSVQEKPEDPIGSLHHCFMLLAGIKVVIGPHWPKIQAHPVCAQMVEMSLTDTLQRLDALAMDDERPEILRLMELTELVLDTQDKAACADSIKELHHISVRVRHVGDDRDDVPLLFMWAARCSNRFFDLLSAHNPVACVITVHFAAMMAELRTVWWVVKWPRWLLAATEDLLGATPDLLGWLDWPRDVINAAPWTATATPSSS